MNRKRSPDIKDATDFTLHLPAYESFHLKNNIPVYLVASNEQETLEIQWVFQAGNWYEASPMTASSANALLKSGTTRQTALEIDETIEYYGAFLSMRCHHEVASLTLHCLEKQLDHLLPVIREMLSASTYPEEELALYKQNKKQQLAVNLKKNDFVANQRIDTYLFGDYHPYGRHSTMGAYDDLQRTGLQAFFKQYYSFNHCRIFAAGKISDQFEQKLNTFFGDAWSEEQQLLQKDFPLQPALEKRHRINNNAAESVQGAVRIAAPFPNRYHPDVPGMQVLNTIFGGYFGSRLMRNIREDKGYTYGIFSYLSLMSQGGSLMIQTEAGKEVCEQVIEEVFKEMQLLCETPVAEAELTLVRNYLIGNLLGDLDGCFKIIRYWKNLLLADLDASHFNRSVEVIKTISAEELMALAQKYFKRDDFYELLVL